MPPRPALSNAEWGIALGKGEQRKAFCQIRKALKRRDKGTCLLRPFRAWAKGGPLKPRALPWVILCEAFGLERRPALVA
jgi:hypothetical protein